MIVRSNGSIPPTRFTAEVSAGWSGSSWRDLFFFFCEERWSIWTVFFWIKKWNSVPTFVFQKAIPCSKWWCFVTFCFSLTKGNGVYTGMTLGIGPSAFLFVLHQSGVGIFNTSGLLANCGYKVHVVQLKCITNMGYSPEVAQDLFHQHPSTIGGVQCSGCLGSLGWNHCRAMTNQRWSCSGHIYISKLPLSKNSQHLTNQVPWATK